jgi:hypothetical protein
MSEILINFETLGALPVKAAEATYKRCVEEGKIK